MIIPVRDAAPELGGLLGRLSSQVRTIVVDNDASDHTAAVARAAGAEVLLCTEHGFGELLRAAVCHIGKSPRRQDLPRIILIADPAVPFDIATVDQFIKPIAEGRSQIVFSRLDGWKFRDMHIIALACMAIVRLLMRLCAGADPRRFGSLVACDYEVLRSMELEDRSWAWLIELIIKAKILSIPTSEEALAVPRARTDFRWFSVVKTLGMALWAVPYYSIKSRRLVRNLHWTTLSQPR